MVRETQQMKEQLALAAEGETTGSRWPGLSYEEGVVATITWVLGLTDEGPMDEERHEGE